MIDLLIEPDHEAAARWATRAYSMSNLDPISGLWLVLRDGNVDWVGLTPWRALIASQAAPGTLSGASGWTRLAPAVEIDDEVEEGKPPKRDNPGKALVGELKEGERVVIELTTAPLPNRVRHVIGLLESLGDTTLDIPGTRDAAWKDDDYLGPEIQQDLVLPKHLLPPFKGLTLSQSDADPHVWGFWDQTKGRGGLVAARHIEPKEDSECQQEPSSPWTRKWS